MHDGALSNTYLVGDEAGGGFFVDAGGPMEPLIKAVERHSIEPTHVLLTHHHADHVWDLAAITDRWPDIEVLIDDRELEAMQDKNADLASKITGSINSAEEITIGNYTVMPLHTPGHTAGMQSLLVEGNVFTGDTLFRNSVGGVRAPGSTSYADLKSSVMDTLMTLPPETVIRPGHTDPTTVAEEWENNSFVRVWRGLDDEGDEPCTAMGEPATLVLLGDDYDGGHKAWVRWPDGGDDIVPGSQINK
ncbi:MAG TPA: MBL fold metallo-hydrolase [Kofleriaceae bacterium]|nr:MBL fold metallo-hydrolase [Kofleriaceae bacterium]